MLSFYDHKKWIYASLLLMLALVSFFLLGDLPIVTQINQSTIAYLNERRETVLKLMVLSTGLSTTITALPGDIGMPVAENIADIADYLMIVFAGIWVQKYLVVISSTIVFKVLVPFSLCASAMNVFLRNHNVTLIIKKVLTFALLVLMLVPMSTSVSKSMESVGTYSVNAKVEDINKRTNEIKEREKNEETGEGLLEQIGDAITGFANSVGAFFSTMIEEAETILADMVETVAVMIITSCLIPILNCWIFIWCINQILATTFSLKGKSPNLVGNFVRKRNRERRELVDESSDD